MRLYIVSEYENGEESKEIEAGTPEQAAEKFFECDPFWWRDLDDSGIKVPVFVDGVEYDVIGEFSLRFQASKSLVERKDDKNDAQYEK